MYAWDGARHLARARARSTRDTCARFGKDIDDLAQYRVERAAADSSAGLRCNAGLACTTHCRCNTSGYSH